PTKVIKESFVLAGGEKAAGLTRLQSVSMGDPEEYSEQAGVLTFRGGPLRQNGAYGTVDVEQEQLSVVRGVRTSVLGNEYTGFGYGSQPLIVKWYSNIRAMMNIKDESRDTKAMKEVIMPSRDGKIYFFDLETNAYSREPIEVGLPLDVTAAVNPFGYPLLYVGQTTDSVAGYTGVIGMRIYNLIDQNLIGFESGLCDQALSTKVGSVVSSPIVETDSDTLIYGADNGLLYTISMNTEFDLENGKITVNPQTAAYGYSTTLRNAQQGISASVATYGDYAYFGDMAGSLQCVDLNTMQCVWAIDMGDSVLASVAIECEDDDQVYLYAGNVINKNERSGPVRLMKVDALTGDIVWECQSEIRGRYASAPAKEGIYAGLMASPVVGKGDINDLVIFNVNRVMESDDSYYAVVYALDKQTGEEVWSQPMDVDSVSSPIALYQPDGKSYLVMGDENGTLRLMDGFFGTTISTVNLGSPIQASPAAYGNNIVVGTTGGMIYFVDLL
ncbi:MAG: PQQ-binding-like beta-propeller repeat protein, partial [Clostridia bacterium]|nr:PQQ-binding-like beta-propeller repeat protein [Clostridia bacterium]